MSKPQKIKLKIPSTQKEFESLTNKHYNEELLLQQRRAALRSRLFKDIRTVVEAFWWYEAAEGASPRVRAAARRLQAACGWRTKWDKNRKVKHIWY